MRILIGITRSRKIVKVESDCPLNDSEWKMLMTCDFLASVGTSSNETLWSVGYVETWLDDDSRHYRYVAERNNDLDATTNFVTLNDRLLKDIALHGIISEGGKS